MNIVWLLLIVASITVGALRGTLVDVTAASTTMARTAVELALGLVGVMTFWLGLMRAVEKAGLMRDLGRLLAPLMRRLFPEVPADHPAMSMMVLNIAANMLGLGNAATPFGIKAMGALQELNASSPKASNSMALFLAINTSGVAVLPLGMIAIRAQLGSAAPGAIVATTLVATFVSTLIAIVAARTLQRLPRFALSPAELALASGQAAKQTASIPTPEPTCASKPEEPISHKTSSSRWGGPRATAIALAAVLALALAWAAYGLAFGPEGQGVWAASKEIASGWLLALLIGGFALLAHARGVAVYDALVEGGKEGFALALKIIPYLVAILVAIGMLRASGAVDLLVSFLNPLTQMLGMPAEALPMGIMRTLSGSGANAVAMEIMNTHGPDSLVGNIVATMQGSTETTFYVLALYYGAISIRDTRHTLWACLIADVAGALAATWACRLLL